MSSYCWYCCDCGDGGHTSLTQGCTNCSHSQCSGCTKEYYKSRSYNLAGDSHSVSDILFGLSSPATSATILFSSAIDSPKPCIPSPIVRGTNVPTIGSPNQFFDIEPGDGETVYRWVCHECKGDNSYHYSPRCTNGNCHHEVKGCSQCHIYSIKN